MEKEIIPFRATHPGEVVREWIEDEDVKISKRDFAKRMAMPYSDVKKLLNGKSDITAEVAEKLSAVLGMDASYWMRLQEGYMHDKYRIAQRDKDAKRHGSGRNSPNNGSDWLAWLLGALLLLCAYLLASCSPYRHLATSDNTRDSVRVETVIRTEYIRDTVEIEIPVERTVEIAEDSSHLETVLAVSDAFLRADGKLYHTLENKAGKRPVEVRKEVVYRDSIVYRDRVVKNTETVEVPRELTWWQKTRLKGFWVLLAVLVVVFRKPIVALARRFV